jgi:hypothetical protein
MQKQYIPFLDPSLWNAYGLEFYIKSNWMSFRFFSNKYWYFFCTDIWNILLIYLSSGTPYHPCVSVISLLKSPGTLNFTNMRNTAHQLRVRYMVEENNYVLITGIQKRWWEAIGQDASTTPDWKKRIHLNWKYQTVILRRITAQPKKTWLRGLRLYKVEIERTAGENNNRDGYMKDQT